MVSDCEELVGIMKFVTKVNGKDVLWSTYTLRFNASENFFRFARQQRKGENLSNVD